MKNFVIHQWGRLNQQQKAVAVIIAGVILIVIVL
jgi:hypothetical protein